MLPSDPGDNPLLSNSPGTWQRLIDAAGPASLLVIIESRMSEALRRKISPEDILQEALLHAWRDRERCEWRGPRSFRSWLLSIIDNRIHDAADHEHAAKRGGHQHPVSLDTRPGSNNAASESSPAVPWPEALAETTTPSRVAIYREQAAAIAEALGSLPEELRDVVRLRLIEQLTIDAVATRLNIGVAAARHRFRKGTELYRQRLTVALASRSHTLAPLSAPDPVASSSAD